jgi:hypothetical protein
MEKRVECFFAIETGDARRALRRYRSSSDHKCSNRFGYHNAEVFLDEIPAELDERGYLDCTKEWPHDDSRWPTHCECGYAFQPDDRWQLNADLYYRAPDGSRFTLREAPIGAIWDAWWFRGSRELKPERVKGRCGPDGRSLVVMLPNRIEWFIDGPSTNGDGWTRTGAVPKITVAPSILARDYHGFLNNGVLEMC